MSHEQPNPLDHPEVRLASTRGYLTGFLISVSLMALSFGLVAGQALSAFYGRVAIATIAVLAVLAQTHFLFHLNWSETQRWHTLGFWLTIPLLVLLLGLSIWMFHSLDARAVMSGVG
ncbi:MAG: hypothetical protein P8124_12640 [Gammaproteobacteria bacterium]|nr:hypothetical protein [Gammaproteobacteria bacterium]